MKGDIPVCTRCCFCWPLRNGLLAWCYLKLIVEVVLGPLLTFYLINILLAIFFGTEQYWIYFIMGLLTIIMLVADFVATIVFLVGSHMKNMKLIRGFYIFSISTLGVTVLLIVIAVCALLVDWYSGYMTMKSWDTCFGIIYTSIYLIILVEQTYLTLLLRSDIIEEKNEGKSLAEAESIMKCKGETAGGDTEMDNV